MFQTPLSQITTLAMLVVALSAFAVGRAPERIGAFALAVNWIGCAVVEDRRWHHHGQPGYFALDGLLLIVMLGVGLRWRRTWVLWACAFCVLLVLTHTAYLADVRLAQWSYQTAYYIWSVGVVMALAAGVALEGRRPAPRVQWTAA